MAASPFNVIYGGNTNTNFNAFPPEYKDILERNPSNKGNEACFSTTAGTLYWLIPIEIDQMKQGIVYSFDYNRIVSAMQRHPSWKDGGFIIIAMRMTDLDENDQVSCICVCTMF